MDQVLSDLVGREIRRYREAAEMSRDEVARRCADAGWAGISSMVLLYIENGRPDASGRRKREISVDELVALAFVLGVPPLALLVPLGDERWRPLSDQGRLADGGRSAAGVLDQTTAGALSWIRGDRAFSGDAGGPVHEQLRLYSQADRLALEVQLRQREWEKAAADAGGDRAETRLPPLWKERFERAEADLREVRTRMRAGGWKPPSLPPGLDWIDVTVEGEGNG